MENRSETFPPCPCWHLGRFQRSAVSQDILCWACQGLCLGELLLILFSCLQLSLFIHRDRLSNGHHHNSLSYSCLSNALSVLEEDVCGSTSHKRPLSQGSKLWSRQVGTGTMKTFSYYLFSVCWVLTGCWVSALSTAALFNTGAWLLPSSHAGLVGGRYCCFPSSSFWSLDWLWHCRWMWQCSAHSGSLKDSAWLESSSPCMRYVSRKTSPSVAAWEVLG